MFVLFILSLAISEIKLSIIGEGINNPPLLLKLINLALSP